MKVFTELTQVRGTCVRKSSFVAASSLSLHKVFQLCTYAIVSSTSNQPASVSSAASTHSIPSVRQPQPAGTAYIVIRAVWQTCFQLLRTVCLEQVTAIHPISQQFQLIHISSENQSVCSSVISTVLLPPSDHPRLRLKPCARLLCTLSNVRMYVCRCHAVIVQMN